MPKLLREIVQHPYSGEAELRGYKWSGDTDAGRIARANWAKQFALGKGPMNPGDTPRTAALKNPNNLKSMAKVGFWSVDEAIRNLIEELDPGRHQFLPITLTTWTEEKRVGDGERYLLNVYCHQSSIIDEMTEATPAPGYEETRGRMLLNYLVPKIAIDPNKLSPAIHLWREDRYRHSLFMSDTLYDCLADLGVEVPAIEVDMFR